MGLIRGGNVRRVLLAAFGIVLLSWQVRAAPTACPEIPPAMPAMHLPHLRTAVVTRTEAIIVALGSSSTEGVMASDLAHSYPAFLQSALTAALPASHVAVINRGIGGQDAPEELGRLETDVIAVRPQLVIWQVGANAAMRHANPAEFRRMVTEGVRRLKAAGIDVILMDNQRAPRVLAAVAHVALESSLSEVAEATGVNLFSRGGLMDRWSGRGRKPEDFLAADGLHHNDLGYRCIATALAERIAAAVDTPVSIATSH